MLRSALWNLLTARGPKPYGIAAGLIIAAGLWGALAIVLLSAVGVGEG